MTYSSVSSYKATICKNCKFYFGKMVGSVGSVGLRYPECSCPDVPTTDYVNDRKFCHNINLHGDCKYYIKLGLNPHK